MKFKVTIYAMLYKDGKHSAVDVRTYEDECDENTIPTIEIGKLSLFGVLSPEAVIHANIEKLPEANVVGE
jgi:hypothetical protein